MFSYEVPQLYKDVEQFVEKIENEFGITGLKLRKEWLDPYDAWALIVDRSEGSFTEIIANIPGKLRFCYYLTFLR